MLRNRPPSRRRVLVMIAENRDKGSGMKVREVLSAAEFANVVIYSVNISQLVAALTSKAQPNRPSTLPPGAEHCLPASINTQTTDDQIEMGNWVPALKDIFLAAKGVFIPDPLESTQSTLADRNSRSRPRRPWSAISPAWRRAA